MLRWGDWKTHSPWCHAIATTREVWVIPILVLFSSSFSGNIHHLVATRSSLPPGYRRVANNNAKWHVDVQQTNQGICLHPVRVAHPTQIDQTPLSRSFPWLGPSWICWLVTCHDFQVKPMKYTPQNQHWKTIVSFLGPACFLLLLLVSGRISKEKREAAGESTSTGFPQEVPQ